MNPILDSLTASGEATAIPPDFNSNLSRRRHAATTY